ncbi:hypothetical protein F4810DRAFT_458006 [Camillea tinctor]|nr:hypothetical protein F4810DRAFT_458006 [Camillea tinctor]
MSSWLQCHVTYTAEKAFFFFFCLLSTAQHLLTVLPQTPQIFFYSIFSCDLFLFPSHCPSLLWVLRLLCCCHVLSYVMCLAKSCIALVLVRPHFNSIDLDIQ